MNFKLRRAYLSILILAITCLYANYSLQIHGDLIVKFLNVGQGDSILIQTPSRRTVLIDGGPATTVLERLGEESSFWQKKIDLIVLTHPDLDHLEGLIEILQRYQIDQVLMTAVIHRSNLYRAFLELLEKMEIKIDLADPHQDWFLDEKVYLDIVSPLNSVAFREVENANNASVVARLVYGQTTLLLSGDAEEDAEHKMLLSETDLRSQILKAGHHGSRTSTSVPFLNSVQAETAVIMSGEDNPFAHPHLDTVLRFDDQKIEWLNTKEKGSITLRSDGEQWTWD